MKITLEIEKVGKTYMGSIKEFPHILINEPKKRIVPELMKQVFSELTKRIHDGSLNPITLLSLSFDIEGDEVFFKYLPKPLQSNKCSGLAIRYKKDESGYYIGDSLKNEILDAYLLGLRVRDIAKEFNICLPSLYRFIKERNIPLRRK